MNARVFKFLRSALFWTVDHWHFFRTSTTFWLPLISLRFFCIVISKYSHSPTCRTVHFKEYRTCIDALLCIVTSRIFKKKVKFVFKFLCSALFWTINHWHFLEQLHLSDCCLFRSGFFHCDIQIQSQPDLSHGSLQRV